MRACYNDYALRDIITEVAAKPVTNKSQRKERIREYKALITALTSRITPADAESLAIESGLYNGVPKYKQQKKRGARAYDVQAGENGLVDFNPNRISSRNSRKSRMRSTMHGHRSRLTISSPHTPETREEGSRINLNP